MLLTAGGENCTIREVGTLVFQGQDRNRPAGIDIGQKLVLNGREGGGQGVGRTSRSDEGQYGWMIGTSVRDGFGTSVGSCASCTVKTLETHRIRLGLPVPAPSIS